MGRRCLGTRGREEGRDPNSSGHRWDGGNWLEGLCCWGGVDNGPPCSCSICEDGAVGRLPSLALLTAGKRPRNQDSCVSTTGKGWREVSEGAGGCYGCAMGRDGRHSVSVISSTLGCTAVAQQMPRK